MHPLSMKVVLLTLSLVSAAAYTICTLFYVVAPQVTLAFFAAMFHGLDLSMIARTGITWGDFFLGLLAILISAVVSGALFVGSYNFFVKRLVSKAA